MGRCCTGVGTMKLVRKNFRAWLEGHRPRQVVATFSLDQDWDCNCPIANFLKAGGAEAVDVNWYGIQIGNGLRVPQAAWVGEFIEGIDSWNVSRARRFTAGFTLKILDSIK